MMTFCSKLLDFFCKGWEQELQRREEERKTLAKEEFDRIERAFQKQEEEKNWRVCTGLPGAKPIIVLIVHQDEKVVWYRFWHEKHGLMGEPKPDEKASFERRYHPCPSPEKLGLVKPTIPPQAIPAPHDLYSRHPWGYLLQLNRGKQ